MVWGAEAYNSKLCDAVVAHICLSLGASSEHFLVSGIPPRQAHLTLKGHPVSCDANSSGVSSKV